MPTLAAILDYLARKGATDYEKLNSTGKAFATRLQTNPQAMTYKGLPFTSFPYQKDVENWSALTGLSDQPSPTFSDLINGIRGPTYRKPAYDELVSRANKPSYNGMQDYPFLVHSSDPEQTKHFIVPAKTPHEAEALIQRAFPRKSLDNELERLFGGGMSGFDPYDEYY